MGGDGDPAKVGDPKPRSPLARAFTWLRRVVVGALVAVLVLPFALYGALQMDYGRELALAQLAPLLSTLLPGELSVGAIHELSAEQLVFSDVVLRGLDGTEVVTIGELRVRVGYAALLHGNVDLTELRVRDALVQVVPTDSGSLTLLDALVDPNAPEDDTPSTLTIWIRALSVEHSTVVVDLPGAPVRLEDVALAGHVEVGETVRATLERLAFRSVRGEHDVLRTTDTTATYDSGPGHTSSVTATFAGGEDRVHLQASAQNPAEPDGDPLDTQIEASLSLSPLTPRLLRVFEQTDLAAPLAPEAHLDLQVSGTPREAHLTATLRVAEDSATLDARYVQAGESRAQLCTDGVTLATLHRELPEQRVRGCFTVTAGVLSEAEVPVTARVEGATVDELALPDLLLMSRVRLTASDGAEAGADIDTLPAAQSTGG